MTILLLIVFYGICSAFFVLQLAATNGNDCNEYICGSVVSKCLLTQSCQCKLSDCYCCKDCLHCLGDLYTECCGCLDMCPKHNETLSALAPKSQIGDFEGVAELFETLTADYMGGGGGGGGGEEDDDDDDAQWTVMRFPMRQQLPFNIASNSHTDDIDRQASRQKATTQTTTTALLTVNCTVVYWNACTTTKKCAQHCESMGANSYRWFHDGCCECVGANCFNYGINESRCIACPADDDDILMGKTSNDDDYGIDENEDDIESWDFGEDEFNYN